jgi:NAD(P)H-hydrate epimerase
MATISHTTIPLPPRPLEGHKGLFGRVLVIGGSDDMIGAPVLAATAALRLGSGLVQLAVPRAVLAHCLTITPELVGLGLSKSPLKALCRAAEKADALVIGPGMGDAPDGRATLKALAHLDKPTVLDADALNLLSREKKWPANWFKPHRAVLTPHPGEMSRLGKLIGRTNIPTDDGGRIAIATQAAKFFNQIVLLKGHRTVITDGQRIYLNQTGDSTLSKAGAGDILSGMIGCLLGQRLDPFDAACLAAHLHGLAGEIVGCRVGRRCALAREVLDSIAEAAGAYEESTSKV